MTSGKYLSNDTSFYEKVSDLKKVVGFFKSLSNSVRRF